MEIHYGRLETSLLWTLALVGFALVNGTFIYGLLRPEVLREALANPVALAFMCEALLLVGVLAFLLAKWGVSRLSWGWFVILSLLGSMAFALPVVLLWPKRAGPSRR